MVTGMESFVQKFRDYTDCYTIIGGAACDILMTEADTETREIRRKVTLPTGEITRDGSGT